MLTLKTLLTFTPLEMGLVSISDWGKLIKHNRLVLLPNRNVLEKKNKHAKNKPGPMLLEIR